MKQLALLLLASSLTFATTVTSQPACQYTGSAVSACGIAGPGGAMASATGAAVLVDAAGSLTIIGNVASYTSGSLTTIANADIDLTVSANLMTNGSGAGFLLISPNITATAAGSGFASVFYSLGAMSYTCTSNPLSGCYSPQPVKVPITLGLALPFILQQSASSASSNSGSSVSSATASLILSAFLADGVTPVDIFDVPEPQTWLLTLLGLSLLLRYRKRAIVSYQRNDRSRCLADRSGLDHPRPLAP